LVLADTKAERLRPRNQTIISTDTKELLHNVFKKIVTANILALPVLNQRMKYYSMIEMTDLVEFITTLFPDLSSTRLIDLENMFVSEKKFVLATVKDIIRSPFSRKKAYKTLHTGFSLITAWEILARGGSRIVVLGETDEVVDIITPSMLVDFLWQNIEKIGKVAQRQVKDFKIETELLVSVKNSTKTIVAFRQMVRTETSGIAIVDDHGKIIDNLSARDLRGIHTDANVFWRLWSTVSEFKKRIREEDPKTPHGLIYVLPTDTLYTVVEKMATLHVHRIYVIDNIQSCQPQRVITQTDILREILENKLKK